MNAKELKERIAAIEAEARERKAELCRAYAYAHNAVKVGDKITDKRGLSIIVEKMGCYIGFGVPEMQYFGPELKKDGTPRKDGMKSTVFQSCL